MASTDIIAWITGGYGKYFLSPWCIVIVWMYKLSTIQMNEENQKNQGQSADKGNSGIKNYGWLAAAVIIAAILGGYFIFRNDIRNMDQLPDNVTLKNETTGETETIIFENPKKMVALDAYGLEIIERVSLEIEAIDENKFYLETKKNKMGHILK